MGRRFRSFVLLGLALTAFVSCAGGGPTPEQVLSDGVVTRAEYHAVGQLVVDCLARLGHEARMEVEPDGAPSFITRGEEGAERAVGTCQGRHIGDVGRVWSDQNAPTPEEEPRFYNSVVSCVELTVGEDLGEYTGPGDAELLNELLAAYRDVYMGCLDATTALP